ncbi:hepatoma-derived growth factor-related protein 2 isoform X1 [Cynara cardunculus var. scolymus]|uniref:hepatoma-derived growth factor-related protein 2 isoform X1 n=1 Tax=Cynara cardunculus var. scolymus TaxID=59895 RepID=UPI000D6287CF|nr:hepatoma-derived growth factor-related protein 2 isoform X1 [Cynara cardunculus var. scolymus]XP_024980568.1 hepatoma-derived growth factor-related protein 2 isoform X1 [Cynara cardunculus var. scolymus]
MSRRETRDSDSRHHRSRFDREPSPKRVRRDGKTATERPPSNLNLDSAEHIDRDQKHHRRVQDSLPLEAPPVSDPKIETVPLSKESDKKSNGYREGTKNSSDKIEAPRSRSLFQHDERAGRSFRHRETAERDWWKDSKDRQSGRTTNRSSNNDDTKPRDEKTRGQGVDHRAWRYDGSYKTEPDLKQPSKKRPSFRETKIPIDAGTDDKSAPEVAKPSAVGSERKEERGKPPEKPPVDRRLSGERDPQQRMKFQSRDRYGGGGGGFGGSNRGRDRFNGRQGQSGGRVEKWKHDLYDEANKSPTSKNEEDQIAKVEALLAS